MAQEIKILCVDDDPGILKSLTRLFLDSAYTLLLAESAAEGLRILEGGEKVQVIIADYRMPIMNGVEFLRQVNERWPESVRIILSGYADTAAVVSAINEGRIYKFIAKPWNDDELQMTITKAVELYFLIEENRNLAEKLQAANEELVAAKEHLEQTVQERTEELIFQNKVLQHSQNILNTLPIGVLGFDLEKNLVQWNLYAINILQKKCASPVGTAANDFLPPDWLSLLAGLKPGITTCRSLPLDDGTYLVKGAIMMHDGSPFGFLLVFEKEQCQDAGSNSKIEQRNSDAC